jgi:hypothetical protein
MRKIVLFLLLCAACAVADPFVTATGIGTRAYGMAGSFTALADDFSALFWNPAGLAFVPVREVHCAFDIDRQNAVCTLGRSDVPAFYQRLRINSAGLLRSVPTVSGGFAFALGFSSPWLLDNLQNYDGADVYRGSTGIDGPNDTLFPGDTLFIDRYSRRAIGLGNLWNAGLGWQIAPSFGFGFSIGLLTGSEKVDLVAVSRTDNGAFENFTERMERTYLGYDLRLGVLYAPSKVFSAGVRLELPRRAGVAENRGAIDYLSGSDTSDTDFGVLRSGLSGAAGVALKLPSVTVSGDWNFRGPISGAPEGSIIDGWVFGASAGVELPLRPLASVVRCGYSYAEFGLSSMAIKWENNGFDEPGTLRTINNRHLVTAGYSQFLGSSVSLDLAYGVGILKFATSDPDWQNKIIERHVFQRGVMSISIRY